VAVLHLASGDVRLTKCRSAANHAIRELTMLPAARRNVVWIGDTAPVVAPFTDRRLGVSHSKIEEVGGLLNSARALIVVQQRGEFGLLQRVFDECAQNALDHGVMVIALMESDVDFDEVRKRQGASPFGKLIQLEFVAGLNDVAETIARATYEVGPSCETVALTGDLGRISSVSQFLLKRAFHDCESIQVEAIDGGFMAECALRVHGWLRASRVGPRPMPFFVKGGTLEEIAAERYNYVTYADHYIPFNLRPNLIPERCVSGSGRALLVGNFVEDAISLRKALQSGQGSSAIFSLFENTLGGFRMQPFTPGNSPGKGLEHFVKNRCWAEKVRPDVTALAESLELGQTPVEVQNGLVAVATDILYRSGPYHGDLHAGNVMVRHRDAIVIDLFSAGSGPLTADPAALEVSLVFDGLPANADFDAWRSFVDQLFVSLPSLRPPVPEAKPTNYSWLYRAVRELRHVLIGLDGVEKEAAVVLGAYMMRFARLLQKPVSVPATFSEKRHAYALVIAERLLKSVQER
jgi:hypothetical protein